MSPTIYYHPAVDLTELGWLAQIDLPVSLAASPQPPTAPMPTLWLDSQGLSLVTPESKHPYRLENIRSINDNSLIKKAFSKADGLSVLDAFAGFGSDTLALAARCELHCVEHNPLIYCLLAELVWRRGLDVSVAHADAWQILDTATPRWDIVYLDPMFSARRKQALPHRGMQVLQMLQSSSQTPLDLNSLVERARASARHKVILKRRAKDPQIGKPDYRLQGHSARLDVYTCAAVALTTPSRT